MKQHFDNYISIGYNCQVAYSIEAIYATTISNMFNWAFVTDNKQLIEFLKKPDMVLTKGISTNGSMYKDRVYGFRYHSKNPKMRTLTGDLIVADKKEVISRMRYLKEKFFKMVKSNDRNLYIMCFRSVYEGEEAANIIDEVYKLLEELSGNKDFRMLVVFEKAHFKKVKVNKHKKLIIKTMKYFSYDRFAYDINYWDWYKIYRQFSFSFENKDTNKFKNIQDFIERYKLHEIDTPISLMLPKFLSKFKKSSPKKNEETENAQTK